MTEEESLPEALRFRILPALNRVGIDVEKLKKSKVAIIGVGGIGSRVTMQLARYPLGEIRVLDNGNVDRENVGYQNFSVNLLGIPKAEAIKELVKAYFPWANIKSYVGEVPDLGWLVIGKRISEEHNIEIKYDVESRLNLLLDVIRDSDLVIVSTDTLGSRASVWLAAMHLDKPFLDVGFRENYGHIYVWFPNYMEPLDFSPVEVKQFIRSEPGYPVEPFTAELISLLASKIAISVINGNLTESVMVYVKAAYKDFLKDLGKTIEVYPWVKGTCKHYEMAKGSLIEALNKLAEGGET